MSRELERLRTPVADNTIDTFLRDVIGSKSDIAATGDVTTTDTLVAYIKQLLGLCVGNSTIVSSGIPNNTQTGGTICTASGDIIIEDIIFSMDDTGFAAPTNIEISTDNVVGETGAAAPILIGAIAAFGANETISKKDATSHTLPMVLESGKSLFIHGDDGAGTGSGEGSITICGRPASVGAYLIANDLLG